MITLYQLPVSPFCITIETIFRYAKVEYRLLNLLYSDRRMIVEKTKGAYYKVPLLEDRETVVWDTTDLVRTSPTTLTANSSCRFSRRPWKGYSQSLPDTLNMIWGASASNLMIFTTNRGCRTYKIR
jgi:hypothetical protein